MARMIRLDRNAAHAQLFELTPNGYCIGLFTQGDLTAAAALAPNQGCIVLQGDFLDDIEPRQQPAQLLLGIVVFEEPLEETPFTSITPRNLLRSMCNTIDSYACSARTAEQVHGIKRITPKPWMLKPRMPFGRRVLTPSWY